MKNIVLSFSMFTERFNPPGEFVARKSNHINDDLKRNWSSWNFGQDGFNGTKEELLQLLELTKSKETSFWISGFDIWVDNVSYDYDSIYVNDFELKELYEDYWVAVDNINTPNGLSCIILKATNINKAIIEANKRTDYFGEGDSFDASMYDLVYSNNDIHILKLKD